MTPQPVLIALPEPLARWFTGHAQEQGISLEQALRMGLEVYADHMRFQRGLDDRVYNVLSVPRHLRVY